MKSVIVRFVTLSLMLLVSLRATAIPMLSNDGSLLSGVEVEGVLYDVTFSDAIFNEAYPLAMIQQPGWINFAATMRSAILDALLSLPVLPRAEDIGGCSDSPGFPGFVGPGVCIAILPDTVDFGQYDAEGLLVINTPQGTAGITTNIFGAVNPASGTGGDTDVSNFLTVIQFSRTPSEVPVAPSLALLLTGLALVRHRLHPRLRR